MAIDKFSIDQAKVKSFTNREGDGVSRSGSPQFIDGAVSIPYYEVSVKEKPGHGSDTTITHTGPMAGTSVGVGKPTDMQGFTSSTGNKVMIDNTFGSDNIVLQHHSGATILIDSDGSIHMISSGKKGVGMVSPKGDATVYAKNHLILKADGKITIETDGDLDLNVGGAFSLHVKGDMHTYVEGSIEEFTDGSKTTEIVKDASTTIAGDSRNTVAGNMRVQVSGKKEIDVAKDFTMRADGNTSISTQKQLKVQSEEDTLHESKGKFAIKSEGEMTHDSKETYTVKATGNLSVESKGKMDTKAQGNMKVSSKANMYIHSTGPADFRSSTTDIDAGPGTPETPGNPADLTDVPKAQFTPPEIIIDNMTSIREAPDFPLNAKRMSKGEFSVYKNEGNQPNPKAEAAASGNQGAGAPPKINGGETLEPSSSGNYDRPSGTTSKTAEKNPTAMPSSIYNTNEKISRHVTVGQILGIRSVPAGKQKEVMLEAMNVAWNIIDPLIEKFGGRIHITSWYRSNSGNHVKGGAVDLRCSNKGDVQTTAEIAAYVRDNLPYSKILLEKNDSPGIHVHLESAQPGQQGGGTVITCADPQCRSSTQGIQLSYAVAALKGRSSVG
jgi:hypothetical protein